MLMKRGYVVVWKRSADEIGGTYTHIYTHIHIHIHVHEQTTGHAAHIQGQMSSMLHSGPHLHQGMESVLSQT